MYDRILVPTDGSTGTAHVVLQAIDLAQQYDATVHGLHVIDSDLTSLLSESGSDEDALELRGEKAVRMVERMAETHGVAVETALRNGDPAKTILEYATECDADIIVCGTHGRSGVRRHLLGSVAERLVRHAEIPVMTVRLPETDVTVETEAEASAIVLDTLDDDGITGDITSIERQLNVWVVEAETDDGRVIVYVDPQTRRTSVIHR